MALLASKIQRFLGSVDIPGSQNSIDFALKNPTSWLLGWPVEKLGGLQTFRSLPIIAPQTQASLPGFATGRIAGRFVDGFHFTRLQGGNDEIFLLDSRGALCVGRHGRRRRKAGG